MLEDPSVAHERIDQWESMAAERVAQATEFANQTAGLTGSAKDRDGLVDVIVDSTGAMTNLWLSERDRHQSAASTAQFVMAIMRAAQAQLAERFRAETVAAYGPDSPSTAAIVANIERRLGNGSGGSDAAG